MTRLFCVLVATVALPAVTLAQLEVVSTSPALNAIAAVTAPIIIVRSIRRLLMVIRSASRDNGAVPVPARSHSRTAIKR